MMEFLERWRNRPPDGYDWYQEGGDIDERWRNDLLRFVRMQEERNEHWLRVAFDKWSMSTLENWERFARAATLVDLQEEWHEQDLQEEWNENSLRVAFDIWKDEICPPLTVDE